MDYSAGLPAETLLTIFHAARLVNSIPTSSKIARRVGSKWGLDPDKYTTYLLAWVNLTHTCDLVAVVGLAEDATAESSLVRILSARCQAGIPVSVVYLRLAEEIDDLRNGRQHSCSEYPDVAAVERAVDALIARPDVRIIGKEEVVPYAIYL